MFAKSLLQKANQPALISQQFRFYRKAHRREINYHFENERKQFKIDSAILRKQAKEDYWDQQTQVENHFLRLHKEERIGKQERDMVRWRTQICNIGWMTEKKFTYLQQREDKILDTMRNHDIAEGKRRLENKYKLDAMTIDSRRWPKLDDLDNTIATNVILPQTVLNYADYQNKLQRLAFHAEQGDHEAMQKLLDKEDVMAKKNSFLQPLYRDLKTTIKHMTFTSEYKVMRQYVRNRALILNALPEGSSKATDGLKALETQYAKLLRNQRLRMKKDVTFKLTVIQKRLEDMFQLLNLWQQYIDIIYAPETEINIIKTLKDNGELSNGQGDIDDVTFANKMENENIEQRLAILFAKDEDDLSHEDKVVQDGLEDAYQSVNEGSTTDTSITTDAEGAAQVARGMNDSQGQGKSESENEGIASSDQDEDLLAQPESTEAVFNDNQMFKTERQRDDVEHQFNFNDQDVEKFTDKISSQFDQKQSQKHVQNQAQKAANEDEDFIGNAQADEIPLNMEKLNLFGVPLSESDFMGGLGQDQNEETLKSRTAKRKFVRELLEVMDKMDEQADPDGIGLVQDFSKSKRFVTFDPSSDNQDQQAEEEQFDSLVYEDEYKLRASIILDAYSQQMKAIDSSKLTFEDQEKFERVTNLLQFLKNIKIVDAPVLLKIYNLHRSTL